MNKENVDKTLKFNQQDDQKFDFDDDYNQQEFMKNQKISQNTQKLSIMDGFNQISQKLKHNTDQNQEKLKGSNDPLTQYFAQLKEQIMETPTQQRKQKLLLQQPKGRIQEKIHSKYNRPSPVQTPHIRSASDNNQQQDLRLPLNKAHERNPSCGDNIKMVMEAEENQSKRNYSSVQDKKKILQPSKNTLNSQIPNQPSNQRLNQTSNQFSTQMLNQISTQGFHQAAISNSLSMKDYFGEQNSFVNKKIHGKNFINNQTKGNKNQPNQKINTPFSLLNHMNKLQSKFKNQNYMKENQMMASNKKPFINQKQNSTVLIKKKSDNIDHPKIVLFKKVIDLSQDPQILIEAVRQQQMRSDYSLFSQTQSTIEDGLFQKAINSKKTTKTMQNVQSTTYNCMQPSYKQHNFPQKHIFSPNNLNHSPNPTNFNQSIFLKKQGFMR